MFKSTVILLTFAISACGDGLSRIGEPSDAIKIPRSSVFRILENIEMPSELAQHVADFALTCNNSDRASLCRNNLRNIGKIEFVDKMKDSIIGSCWKYINGYRKIQILRSFVTEPNSMAVKTLMYHELGHCALDLEHKGSYGIMAPTLLDYDMFRVLRWQNLIKDMLLQTPGMAYLTDLQDETDSYENSNNEDYRVIY